MSTDEVDALRAENVRLCQRIAELEAECENWKQIVVERNRSDAILKAVTLAADLFLKNLDLNHNLNIVLRHLGIAAEVSRLSLFEYTTSDRNTHSARRAYSWVAPEHATRPNAKVPSSIDFRTNGIHRWIPLLRANHIICGKRDSFPEHEQSFLDTQDIRSLLVVPIFTGLEWYGFIACDVYAQERTWTTAEIDAIKTAAGIIGEAIQRYRVQCILDKNEAESCKLYRAIDHFPLSIAITNRQGVIEYVNPRFTEITGYSYDDSVGKTHQLLQSGQTPNETYHELWSTILAGQEWHGEILNRHACGDSYWASVSISPITNAYGTITHFVATTEDTTQQKKVEEELHTSRALLKSIIDYSPAAIYVKDVDGRYLIINSYGAHLVNLTIDDIIGNVDENIFPPHIVEEFRLTHQSILDTGQAVTSETELVIDGQRRQFLRNRFPLYDGQGKIFGTGGIATEITEFKRIEKQLIDQQRTLSALQEREHLARELHDTIGQVLGYVNTQAQSISELLITGNTNLAYAQLAQLIHVVQDTHLDIREFILGTQVSREIESASDQANVMQSSSVQHFFSALTHYMQGLEELYDFHVTLDYQEDITDDMLFSFVKVHLLRIIQEALTNVRRHAGVRTAHISFEVQAKVLCVRIVDTGYGFDTTGTYALPSESKDTGLCSTSQHFGLQSMLQRAEAVGGELQVNSVPSQGTSITIHIPLDQHESRHIQSLRFMLVDNNALFVQGLWNMLTTHGFTVVGTATNGIEAEQRVPLLQPDIILMDIHMPVCDGLEATRRIKQLAPDVQIIMLTVSDDDANLFEAIKCGASGYLLKNLESEDLYMMVMNVVRGEMPLSPLLASRVLRECARQHTEHPEQEHKPDAGFTYLTPEQEDILNRAAQGSTYKQIGDALGLSEVTIKRRMGAIIEQLHVTSRAEAVAYARRRNS